LNENFNKNYFHKLREGVVYKEGRVEIRKLNIKDWRANRKDQAQKRKEISKGKSTKSHWKLSKKNWY
jgi:hypothetical protein